MKVLKRETRRFLSRYSDDVDAWTAWDIVALIGLGFAAADVFQLTGAIRRWRTTPGGNA